MAVYFIGGGNRSTHRKPTLSHNAVPEKKFGASKILESQAQMA